MKLDLIKSLLDFIAPSIVTENFELVSVDESKDCYILRFEELSTRLPNEFAVNDFKLNGFTNKIELHSFPQKGKSCYLHIYRRRWTNTTTGESFSNTYELHPAGMKATKDLGAFLKKNNRVLTD